MLADICGANPTARVGPWSARAAAASTYTALNKGNAVPGGAPVCRGGGQEMEGSQIAEELEFGSKKCACPKCGKVVPHSKRGIPCSDVKCPDCGTPMKGERCGGVE